MADRAIHYIESEGGKVGVKLPDVYSQISATVGVTKLTAQDKLAVLCEVDDLKQSGVAMTLSARVQEGTEIKTMKILCSMKLASSAVGQLVGKTVGTATIKSVGIKRERVLR